jgi:hypothetical protein
VIVSATHTVNPRLRRGMPFDAIADFAPITLATTHMVSLYPPAW